MDDLLDFVLEVHGALRRWPGVSALHRKARRRLAVLEEQRIPRLFGDRAVDICTRRQHAVLTPSSPTYPGVRGPRDQPVEGRWPAWGRPHATVPAVIATHTGEQVFYFGEDGLLRRMDYTVGVSALAAHTPVATRPSASWPSRSATCSTAAALMLRRRRCAVSPVVPTGLDPLTKRPTVKHHHHCSRQPLMMGY